MLFNFSTIPPISPKNVAVYLVPKAERAIRQGHPWLFEDSIGQLSHEGQAGDLAILFDRKRRFLAVGLFDPTSSIRVRVLQANQPTTIDERWLMGRMKEASQKRAELPAQQTTGYRLIHGENDGLPGLVVDRYGEVLVVKLYTVAWVPWLGRVLPALGSLTSAKTIVLRLSRAVQKQTTYLYGLEEGQPIWGERSEATVPFLENGLRFVADVQEGQKTGFFFDQRDNRAKVETLTQGKDVLNLFAYTGGFSLYAARGGAKSVVSVDSSRPALAMAETQFALNRDVRGVRECRHRTWATDVFVALKQLSQENYRFDVVVVDPPTFAKQQSEVEGALHTYKRLVQEVLPLMKAKGYLVMSSCSSRIDSTLFFDHILQASQAIQMPLTYFAQTGHPIDHPIGFAEGAYLKCGYAHLR